MVRTFVAIAIASVSVVSCSSAAKDAAFPTREELGAIAAQPITGKLFSDTSEPMETWTLAGPLPDALDGKERAGDEAVDKALHDQVAKGGGGLHATEALHCIARETAHVIAEREVPPPRALRRFIAARCGAPSSNYSFASVTLPADKGGAAKVTDRLTASAPKLLADAKPRDEDIGLALVTGEKRAALVMASQPRTVRLDPMPFAPSDGKSVTLRGELVTPGAAKLRAVVNRGAAGFADCEVKSGVALPAFEIHCETAPEDAAAWIQVAAFMPGRILGRDVIETLVYPKAAPPGDFSAPIHKADAAIDAASIVKALNARRAEASLAPVVLDAAESASIDKVTPHFFAAAAQLVPETIADKVILGLQAGWDVQGMVQIGKSASVVSAVAGGPLGLVDDALAFPMARSALFDPEVRRVAVGIVNDAPSKHVGVLLGAYEIIEPERHPSDAGRVVERLTKLRAARNLPAPVVVDMLDPKVAHIAEVVGRGEESIDDGLREMMRAAGAKLQADVRGFALPTYALDTVELPAELVALPDERVIVVVGHHREEGHAWTNLVVYLIVAAPEKNLNTAARPRPAL